MKDEHKEKKNQYILPGKPIKQYNISILKLWDLYQWEFLRTGMAWLILSLGYEVNGFLRPLYLHLQ